MDTKGIRVEVKDPDQGTVSAVFSTFNVVDKDDDVTLPGAFTDGQPVRISAYGHESWFGALPVGKGRVRTTDSEAILDGQFFLNTTAGRDTFEVVREMGELQEWSYGFDVLDAEFGTFEGKHVQYLKRLHVHEASPVLLGAGVNTRTLDVKGAKRAISSHDTPTTTGEWDGPGVVAAIPNDASPADMRSVFAWVDGSGDPGNKSSYKFPHHGGVGGAANVRGCTAGIAVLNGARGGSDIPDSDRQGVYNHLAAHLRDAEREPPELRSRDGGGLKFGEEAALVMAGVQGLLDRAADVMALRAEKGKGLAPQSADLLDWINADLRKLQSLLSKDDETGDVAREFARFVANKEMP